MKKLLVCSLILLNLSSAFAEVQQDIVFKSRFDLESSHNFINQLRIFLRNSSLGDPYSQVIKKPIVIDLKETFDEIPRDTQRWLQDLQSLLQINLIKSDYKLVIEKFGYSLKEFNSELRPGNSNNQRVEYVTVNYVNGLQLFAQKVSIQVELMQMRGGKPVKYSIELIEPTFTVGQEFMQELSMGWATSILPKNILLTLDSVDISKIMQGIMKNPNLIDLKIKDMIMPDISIKVGNKEINFDQKKIKTFFTRRNNEFKKGLLDILQARMGERFENIFQDSPKELMLDKIYGFNNEIHGVIDIQKMDVNNTGIVQFDFDGHFCPEWVSDDFCKDNKIEAKLRRSIQMGQYQKSLREMNRSLIEKKTNIAFSISENYLNQLIEATIASGLWEENLKGKDFTLGPEKSFVLADEKGELFSLYLDIIYKLKGAQRILVGRSELRFPIKFMIGLNIKEKFGIPHFTIKVKDIATDHKLLLNGVPDYGLPSTVNAVRFKKKVLKAIMKEVNAFKGETFVDIEMRELQGTYLDQLKFFSDGLGRGTATIGFKP